MTIAQELRDFAPAMDLRGASIAFPVVNRRFRDTDMLSNAPRTLQLARFEKLHSNAQIGAREIKRYCSVKEDAEKLLETAINKLGLSARAYSRVLKVDGSLASGSGANP